MNNLNSIIKDNMKVFSGLIIFLIIVILVLNFTVDFYNRSQGLVN